MAHSTLTGLAEAVASEMASNVLSRETQVAMRCLEDAPECTFDLLELIAREGRKKRAKAELIGAYAMILMLERLRATLLDWGKARRIGAPMLLLVLNQFAAAKLDVGDAVRAMMASVMADNIDAMDALGCGEDAGNPAEIAKLLEGDAFAIHAHLDHSAEALPEDLRAQMVIGVLDEEEPAMREAALGFLLNGSSRVRAKLAGQLKLAARHGRVSPTMMRRMIGMRNWVPAADQPALDAAIKASRLQGVACAPWPQQPQTLEVMASAVDGSGAQTVLVIVRHAGKAALAALLVKHGIGVRDAWVRRQLKKAELRSLLGQVKGEIGIAPSTTDYVRTVVDHFLAIGGASGLMPPFGLLDFAETVGLADLNPDPRPPETLVASLCAAMEPDRLSAGAVARTMRASASWASVHPMVDSWVEDNLGKGLRSRRARRDQHIAVLLAGPLQSRRRRWAEIAAWTALSLKHRPGNGDWQSFAILANELLGQRPLDEIGIMKVIASNSLEIASMQDLLGTGYPA
jgi:hypothetical protein